MLQEIRGLNMIPEQCNKCQGTDIGKTGGFTRKTASGSETTFLYVCLVCHAYLGKDTVNNEYKCVAVECPHCTSEEFAIEFMLDRYEVYCRQCCKTFGKVTEVR